MKEVTSFSRIEFQNTKVVLGADLRPKQQFMVEFARVFDTPQMQARLAKEGGFDNVVTIRCFNVEVDGETLPGFAFTTKEKPADLAARKAKEEQAKKRALFEATKKAAMEAKKKAQAQKRGSKEKQGYTPPTRPAKPRVEKVTLTKDQIYEAAFRQRTLEARAKFNKDPSHA